MIRLVQPDKGLDKGHFVLSFMPNLKAILWPGTFGPIAAEFQTVRIKFMGRIFDKFRNDIHGIVWSAASLFIGLSLASFSPTDPSFNSSHQGVVGVHNFCGYFGSFLSDLLYQCLGIASWVVIFFTARLALRSFHGRESKIKKWRVLWGVLLLIVTSSLISLYFPEIRIFNGQIRIGGVLGLVLSKGLIGIFNPIGVGVILWSSAVVLVVFYTEKPLSENLASLRMPLWSLLMWWRAQREAARARALEKARATAAQQAEPNALFELKINRPSPLEKEINFGSHAEETSPEESEMVVEGADVISIASIRNKIVGNAKGLLNIKEKPVAASKKRPTAPPQRTIENWTLPNVDLLTEPPANRQRIDEREITRNARLVEQKLAEFDVTGQVVEVRPGPAVTMYEFRPAASVKINDITKLTDDLALALSAESLRMIAPIPGRDVVGIETSNSRRDPIYMKELLESPDFWNPEVKLPIALGKGVSGETKIVDLRKMPHLLVAGTTGSGKSVFIASLLTSLIMRHSPKTLRLVVVDPKQVDMVAFHQVPHLLLPAVKEAKPAVNTLKWLIREMERRYRSMARFQAKNLESFNEAVSKLSEEQRREHEERIKIFEENPQTKAQAYYCAPQPLIVAVIEEFADLMSVDKGGVEPAVVRLAQMARASGIHLVIAMQSPRREVLTGLIKTNFPGRISFKVASKVDSQIILDQRGAERLLSVGDMLFLAPGMSQPNRFHGAYLTEDEIGAVTGFWCAQGQPLFDQSAVASADSGLDGAEGVDLDEALNPDLEEGYDEVVAFVTTQKEVSASLLQRRFRYGYPKAARIIEILEREGVVGPANGSKPRVVFANRIG